MPSDVADALRTGLRSLAKAVAVITCRHEGVRYAMAATAISELSLDPPSMLVCINREASLYTPFVMRANFCINILHSSQTEISVRCGGQTRGEDRFALGKWRESSLGAPWLEDAQASFVCRNAAMTEFGTHGIFVGEVVEVFGRDRVDPLVYMDGRYGRVALA